VYSANYSIGGKRLPPRGAKAARLLANEPEYGAWAWEVHHSRKKDAPSGTLLQLVEEMKRADIRARLTRARTARAPIRVRMKLDLTRRPTHHLRHSPRSREGFARGALKAAQWVIGKRGLHEFGEVILRATRKPCGALLIDGFRRY